MKRFTRSSRMLAILEENELKKKSELNNTTIISAQSSTNIILPNENDTVPTIEEIENVSNSIVLIKKYVLNCLLNYFVLKSTQTSTSVTLVSDSFTCTTNVEVQNLVEHPNKNIIDVSIYFMFYHFFIHKEEVQ